MTSARIKRSASRPAKPEILADIPSIDVDSGHCDPSLSSGREPGRGKFIPVRKEDLLGALIKQGEFASTAECKLFRRFARTLRNICHYEYSEMLDQLRDDYYYFSPEIAGLASADRAKSDFAYNHLIRSLDGVLKGANFEELPHEEVSNAHRRRTVPVEVKAKDDDFREVRFYRRGHHVEEVGATEWLGLRRRTVEIEVFDDVVLVVTMKPQAEINSRRELRALKRRKIVPGSVLLKYFRNIACGDLYALIPNARVVMSSFDKAFLGLPAIAAGIPILLKLYATISVLLIVIGVYLGGHGSVSNTEMKTALAALAGIVGLGGFFTHQWLKYQRRSLRYHVELADNVYYRNVSNNAGIFDYLIATAEDQECKQALLTYHFIHKMEALPTIAEIAARIEAWLADSFEVEVGFDIDAAIKTLDRFGLVRYEAKHLSVPGLEQAIPKLHEVWNNFFKEK
jgi:Protein of unknown function (DUF3754)